MIYNSINSGGYSQSDSTPNVVSVGQSVISVDVTDPKAGFIPTLNRAPSAPFSLGPEPFVSSTWTTNTQPTLSFTLPTDPDFDLVGYEIQISTYADYSLPIVHYRSGMIALSTTTTFTIGQAAGNGSYLIGSSTSSLADGQYYWRVASVDQYLKPSTLVNASTVSFAFGVDISSPTVPEILAPNGGGEVGTTYTFDWTDSADAFSGVASYEIEISTDNFASINFSTVIAQSAVLLSTMTYGTQNSFSWRIKAKDFIDHYSDWSSTGMITIDLIAPGIITDLVATSTEEASGIVYLNWSVPGDDGYSGQAVEYDVRYSTNGIIDTESEFVLATQATGEPMPVGTKQNMCVTGLNSGKTYFFSIKTKDNVSNWSRIDNSTANVTTLIENGDGTTLQWVGEWGEFGIGNETLEEPLGIDGDGQHIYVGDNNICLIKKFSAVSTGAYENSWEHDGSAADVAINNQELFAPNGYDVIDVYDTETGALNREIGVFGSGPGQFKNLSGIGIDAVGHLIVADFGNDRIQVLTSSGGYLREWPFIDPSDVAADGAGNVYVREELGDKVFKYSSLGELIKIFDIGGMDFGYIDVDQYNNVYVASYSFAQNSGVFLSKFDPNGNKIAGYYGAPGTKSGDFGNKFGGPYLTGIYIDTNTSNVSLIDYWNARVQLFKQSTGDVTPPAKITTLVAKTIARNQVELHWTAPGADIYTGTASSYDVRYATVQITNANFSTLPQWSMSPPQSTGNIEITTVSVLNAGTIYYFAIKAIDNNGNISPLSVVKSTCTKSNRTIVFNEVASAQSDNNDLIEFYVAEPINAGGFMLYENESSMKTFPTSGAWATEIPSGTYITLHLGDTQSTPDETTITNNKINLYSSYAGIAASDNVLILSTGTLSFENDQIVGGTIIDMLAYADQDTSALTASLKGKIISSTSPAQNQWSFSGWEPNQMDCVNSHGLSTGTALARDQYSTKCSPPSKYDWSFHTTLSTGSVNSASTTVAGVGTSTMCHTFSGSTVAVTGSTGTWTISYYVPNPTSSNDRESLTIDVPSGWSVPQVDTGTIAGYVWLSTPTFFLSLNYSTNTYALSVATGISDISGRIIIPMGALSAGTTVQLIYGCTQFSDLGAAVVQSSTGTGTAVFTVRVDETGNNVGSIATSPSLSISSSTGMGAPMAARIIGPDPTFKLGEVYAFPNPAKHGKKPTIHVETGIADDVHYKFYDVAGDLVHEADQTGMPLIVNDGHGPEYAYEYTWEDYIPSGTYIYKIRAHKNGFSDLEKISKLAVIR